MTSVDSPTPAGTRTARAERVPAPAPAATVLRGLKAQGILGGLDLKPTHPEIGHALLVCATETKNGDDLARFAEQFERIIGRTGRRKSRALNRKSGN